MAALSNGCTTSIIETDNVQERLDRAAPILGTPPLSPPQAGRMKGGVGQTFVSHYSRLSAVELLLVVYPHDGSPLDAPRHLTFHLRSDPQDEADLVTLNVDISNLKHNDPCRLSFPPQADSEDKTYYFFLEAVEGNKTTVWCSSFDAYGEGAMYLDGQPSEGDLHFKTYYDYNLALMVRDVWHGLLEGAWLILPLLALFTLPGYFVYSLLVYEPEAEPLEHLALVVCLSLAVVPLALLFCSVLGISWNRTRVLIAVVALGIAALWRLASTDFRDLKRWLCRTDRPFDRLRTWPFIAAFLFIFLVSLLVRFLHIRTLVVPAWIDSVHHTLITQLIVNQGGVPQSYEPLLPIGRFIYHFGFHSLVAVFHWLTGLEIPRAMLVVGQVINGLMVLSAYLLVKCLTGRRLAGLFGALIVGLVSTMPAYYVSWGRYTQLTGLVLLPSAIAFTMRSVGRSPACPRRRLSSLMLAAISLAGLLLTHYRVLIFYGCFVLAYLLYQTFNHRGGSSGVLRYWSRAATVCLLAVLLTLPWLVNLARALLPLATLPSRMRGTPSYNVVPHDLITVRHNRELIALSLCGLFWGLYKRERAVILTALWVAIVIFVTNPTILSLPSTWLVNNASLAISLFVPFAIMGGYLLASLFVRWSLVNSSGGHWSFRPWSLGILSLVIGSVALWGASGMLSIVNPSTVLATRDDVAAMDWIRRHVPSDAVFLINVRHWQGGTYVGTDGGYWIPLLTGHDTILPPAIYIYGSSEYVKGINDFAEAIIAVESFDEESTRQLLDDNGVTHVYIGARGGSITPRTLMGSSYYRPVYSNGAVWIFQVQG